MSEVVETAALGNQACFFFVHVMRTGGATLGWHAMRTYTPDGVYPSPRDTTREFRDAGRAYTSVADLLALPDSRRREVRFYRGHFPYVVTELLGRDFVVLTILRDPVDRTISAITQAQELRPDDSLEAIYEDPRSFSRAIHNHQTKIFSMTAEEAPLGAGSDITVDRARLEVARANLDRVDVVGFHDRYEDFLGVLGRVHGWKIGAVAPQHVTDTKEISEAFRRRIAADNVLDVELYEHALATRDRR